MPRPPAFTNDLEYSSVRNDRQMLAPGPPLNGPWPTPENICWNMLLRNTASKSSPFALALAARLAAGSVLPASAAVAAGDRAGAIADARPVDARLVNARLVDVRPVVITSPRFRPGLHRRP